MLSAVLRFNARLLISAVLLAVACGDDPDKDVATTSPTAAVVSPTATAAGGDVTPTPPAVETVTPVLWGEALVEALRGGGYVIVVRHALTDLMQVDEAPSLGELLADCANQRNLSAEGRAQSRDLGLAIERLVIPHTITKTSGYCRTRETAGLAFGIYEVDVDLLFPANFHPLEPTVPLMEELFATIPPSGLNAFMVTHTNNIVAVGLPRIAEGDSLVLEPDGSGWRLIAHVTVEDWQSFPE
jgi:hypothetical protein